jgi:ribokinase
MKSINQPQWDLVVLGGINTDYTIRGEALPKPGQSVPGDSFFTGPGGKGANQAVAAARLGARVAMIGRVGGDARGRELVRNLKRENINTSHVAVDSRQPTGAAIISVDAQGEKQISAALGANQAMTIGQVRAAEKFIASARVLLCNFEAPPACVLAAARIAAKHGIKVILDPAPPAKIPKELFPLLFAIRPNSDEAEQITGISVCDRASALRAARQLLRKDVQIAALEVGDAGNLILSDSEELFLPRLKVKTVDATGAGDAFAGALAAGLAEGLSIGDAARFATVTSALSTTKFGAQDALPRRREVNAILRRS